MIERISCGWIQSQLTQENYGFKVSDLGGAHLGISTLLKCP
jgi:hypothetical protein